jgi:hypothetical protein
MVEETIHRGTAPGARGGIRAIRGRLRAHGIAWLAAASLWGCSFTIQGPPPRAAWAQKARQDCDDRARGRQALDLMGGVVFSGLTIAGVAGDGECRPYAAFCPNKWLVAAGVVTTAAVYWTGYLVGKRRLDACKDYKAWQESNQH